MDVSKHDSVTSAFEFVKSKLPSGKGLWGLVNNAGIGGEGGPVDWLTVDDYKSVAAVNMFGVIDVTTTFLPLLQQARGRVVNTASMAGRVAIRLGVPYCTTKFGVVGFTDGLRRAMYDFGVKVITIEPGNYRSAINAPDVLSRSVSRAWETLSDEKKQEYGESYPESYVEFAHGLAAMGSDRVFEVADAYQHALLGKYPRTRYVVGMDAEFFWIPLSYLPEWLADFLLRLLEFKHPKPACLRHA